MSTPLPPMKPLQQQPAYAPAPSGGSKWLPGCLIGCGIVFFLFVVMISIGVYVMATRGPGMMAGFAQTAINDALDEIDELPPEEKELIKAQVDRVVVAFKKGDITFEQLSETIGEIAESPVIGAVALLILDAQYINVSGLTDEEKEEAARTVQRIWRGLAEKKIDPDDLDPALEIIEDDNEKMGHDNGWNFKEKLTDEELRSFLEKLKTLADDAEIPDEEFNVSIGNEIKRIVDDLLN